MHADDEDTEPRVHVGHVNNRYTGLQVTILSVSPILVNAKFIMFL